MTADELRALADRLDIVFGTKQAAAIIRTVADLQEPARQALAEWRVAEQSTYPNHRAAMADTLADIVERIVEVGDV